LEKCVRLARGIGDIPLLAVALNNLGDVAIILGEVNRTEEHLRASLALTAENEMPGLECVVSNNLGNVALARGDLLLADELAMSSARLAQALNWTEQSMYALELLAAVAARHQYAGRAAELLGAAETLRERLGTVLSVFEQRTHDETLELLRAALEPGELSELWELGRGLSADAALALARPPAQQSAA
jgi:tetratricopeptide (TPR) repeat protein